MPVLGGLNIPLLDGLSQPELEPQSSAGVQDVFIMRHSEREDQVNPHWVLSAPRPWDPPLTERGKRMAFSVGKELRGKGITQIAVSPFLRCVMTAAEVLKGMSVSEEGAAENVEDLKVRVFLEDGLSEMLNKRAVLNPPTIRNKDPCDWSTWILPRPQLEELLPPKLLDHPPSSNRIPHWEETEEEAHERYRTTLNFIADQSADTNVLCVTHGEGVSHSVKDLVPVVVRAVDYCAYSHRQREKRTTGELKHDWKLLTKSGETGIIWRSAS